MIEQHTDGTRLAFTATRSLRVQDRQVIEDKLKGLSWVTEFTTGAAPGGDQEIALFCMLMYPDVLHRFILPRLQANTQAHHLFVENVKKAIGASPHGAGWKCEVVLTELTPMARNDVILDHGDQLLGFPKLEERRDIRSGTWACIRKARKRSIPRDVFILRLDGRESEEQ